MQGSSSVPVHGYVVAQQLSHGFAQANPSAPMPPGPAGPPGPPPGPPPPPDKVRWTFTHLSSHWVGPGKKEERILELGTHRGQPKVRFEGGAWHGHWEEAMSSKGDFGFLIRWHYTGIEDTACQDLKFYKKVGPTAHPAFTHGSLQWFEVLLWNPIRN